MQRYNLRKDARQFAINKRWMAYAGSLFHWFWALVPLLLVVVLSRHDPRPAPRPLQLLLLGIPAAAFVGFSLYTLWKILRGGDTFVFDARTRMFERNGHVVTHWDGISQIVIVDVPHQRDRRGGMLRELLNQEEYYYTYRLVILLHNGKKHVVDECADKQTITELANDIAAYTHKPVSSDLANAGWFA